ncbi:hypothetical protein KY285_030723 [Solanum tuberosum]|nr:hypothetical protein KY284_030543 [Solanum tuberosum]KAH0655841.1 hypothetical protein KY285_030723 [Solanum tuberosum]
MEFIKKKQKGLNKFQRKAKAKKKLVRHQLEHNNLAMPQEAIIMSLNLSTTYGPDIGDDEDPILRPKTISEADTLLAMRKSRMTQSTGSRRIQFTGDATEVLKRPQKCPKMCFGNT